MTMLSLCLLMGAAAPGQPGADAATRVAVVDVPMVSEKYRKTAELEAQFKAQSQAFAQARKSYSNRMEQLARSLEEELKPGTDAFSERRKQLVLLEAEAKLFVETEGRRIEAALAFSLRTIFDDIQRVVQVIAEEQSIDIVLAADRLPTEKPETTSQARQEIMLKKVLYWHPRTDITAFVIDRLNADYAITQLGQPQTSATPTDNDEPGAGADGTEAMVAARSMTAEEAIGRLTR